MGRVLAPYGIRGWFHVRPFTEALDGLAAYPGWWLGRSPRFEEHQVAGWKIHAGGLVAQLEGVEDRARAESLQGLDIAIPRDRLPPAGPDQFYWSDLIGLEVTNPAGAQLGRIVDMMATGANDVMVVQGSDRRRLIPFVAPLLLRVSLAEGRVWVDWEPDY